MSKKTNLYYHIIYGKHACESVLDNQSRKIFEILILDSYKMPDRFLQQYKGIIRVVDKKSIEKISQCIDKHQGIIIKAGDLVEKKTLNDLLSDIEDTKYCYGLILDRVQDPQNIGSIIRSSCCFGANFIIVNKNEAPSINNTIIRASVGMSEVVPIYTVVNIAREIDYLKKMGFWIIGLDSGEKSDFPDRVLSKFSNRVVFVMGSEGSGMRDLTRKQCDAFIKIPMVEGAESLNVSNASTVICYEAFKISLSE